MKQERLLKDHLTIYEFAKKLRIYPNNVYVWIRQGKVVPDLIGAGKHIMIDWQKYGKIEFRKNPTSKGKIKEFFDYSNKKNLTNKVFRNRYKK